jgi:hypothetical protein
MPQLLGLLAALICPLVMFVALFLVIRTPNLKWRIAWAVLCFVGVGAFWMRASDGDVGLRAGGDQPARTGPADRLLQGHDPGRRPGLDVRLRQRPKGPASGGRGTAQGRSGARTAPAGS